MICTKGLPRWSITPNEYQKSDQKTRARKHFDQLSYYLHGSIKTTNVNHGHNFAVYSLTSSDSRPGDEPKLTASTFDDGKNVSKDKILVDRDVSETVEQGPKDNGAELSIADTGTADKSIQVNRSMVMSKDSLQGPNSEPTATVVTDHHSCVDLKGLAKLKKLSCILRKRVNELKMTYEKSNNLGYSYTESEHANLNSGLRSLEDGTIRLLQTLDNIDGYSKEMKYVINIYTDYETLYRKLRSVNKNAKSRARTQKTESDCSGTKFNLCTMLKNYILCTICFNV